MRITATLEATLAEPPVSQEHAKATDAKVDVTGGDGHSLPEAEGMNLLLSGNGFTT